MRHHNIWCVCVRAHTPNAHETVTDTE